MLNSEKTCDQSEFEKGMWTSRRPQLVIYSEY